MDSSCIDPQSDPRWSQLVDRYETSVFHSPEWITVLKETYGLDIRAYVACDTQGAPLGGTTFCRTTDILNPRITTMPFSDYCDPLVSDQEMWKALTEKLFAENCPIVIRCLRNPLPLNDDRFTHYNRAKWHGMDLRPDLDTLWKGIDESSRRAIRKARNSGVVVRPAQNKEELRAFFELQLKLRKYKYRLLAQPYRFFERIWEHFVVPNKGFLMVALQGDEIIGGIFFLGWKGTLYYKVNASAIGHLSHRPNDVTLWESIVYAKEQGYEQLDFGLSDWDQEGLLRYKRKFATEEQTISFLRYTPHTSSDVREAQIRTLLPQLTDLLTDTTVPDHVTEKAGELLYHYFI